MVVQHRLTLPHQREMATRRKTSLVQLEGSCRRARPLSDVLINGAICKDCVLCKTTQCLSHKGNEINPCRVATERWEDTFWLTPTWRAWAGLEAGSSRV